MDPYGDQTTPLLDSYGLEPDENLAMLSDAESLPSIESNIEPVPQREPNENLEGYHPQSSDPGMQECSNRDNDFSQFPSEAPHGNNLSSGLGLLRDPDLRNHYPSPEQENGGTFSAANDQPIGLFYDKTVSNANLNIFPVEQRQIISDEPTLSTDAISIFREMSVEEDENKILKRKKNNESAQKNGLKIKKENENEKESVEEDENKILKRKKNNESAQKYRLKIKKENENEKEKNKKLTEEKRELIQRIKVLENCLVDLQAYKSSHLGQDNYNPPSTSSCLTDAEDRYCNLEEISPDHLHANNQVPSPLPPIKVVSKVNQSPWEATVEESMSDDELSHHLFPN